MNELLEFLTSKEIIVVYMVAGLACLLCFVIYLIEKNNEKMKRRQNTRELNRLVEEINEAEPSVESPVMYEEPIMEPITSIDEASSVTELLESTIEMEKVNTPQVTPTVVVEKSEEKIEAEPLVIEPMDIVTEVVEEIKEELVITEKIEEEQVELQYTSIEPDQATAKLELERLTEELRRQEAEKEQEVENIALTNYEEEQEENAIISLEELVKKSKEMYEANEITQYADEGNEPISLQDLERKLGENSAQNYAEPFIIENVVNDELVTETPETVINQTVVNNPAINTVAINTQPSPVIEKEEQPVIKEAVVTNKRFQSSPIISPIYGIEKNTNTELELENTANYEKLDEEIKKTNEFLMTLKELQKKLD